MKGMRDGLLLKSKCKELEDKIEEMEKTGTDNTLFKAIKLLNKRKFENPKIEDTGKLALDPKLPHPFKSKFKDKSRTDLTSSQEIPKSLNKTITTVTKGKVLTIRRRR